MFGLSMVAGVIQRFRVARYEQRIRDNQWKVAATKHAIAEVLCVEEDTLTDETDISERGFAIAVAITKQAQMPINPRDVTTVGNVLNFVEANLDLD